MSGYGQQQGYYQQGNQQQQGFQGQYQGNQQQQQNQMPQQGYQQQGAFQNQMPQNGGTAIVGQQFVVRQTTHLSLKEKKLTSFSGDDFSIKDSNGQNWFFLDNKTFSFRDQRVLLDSSQRELLTMKKMMFTIGTKWQANGPGGQRLFTIEPKILSFTPQINIYLNDGDREPDFRLKGSFMNGKRDFQIVDIRGGGNTVIGSCKKERAFSGIGAFFNNMIDKDVYYLTLNPGADAAFCVAICLLLDEFYHDS